MKRMIESVMQRATIFLVCVVLILAWGVVSAIQMQRDYLPDINNTTLMVSLHASSYQADLIKKDITAPLEAYRRWHLTAFSSIPFIGWILWLVAALLSVGICTQWIAGKRK